MTAPAVYAYHSVQLYCPCMASGHAYRRWHAQEVIVLTPAQGLTLLVDCSQSSEDLTQLAQTFREKYARALRFMMSLGYISIWLIGATPETSVALWPPP